MIIKCGECGKEYQIKFIENPKDYQCECGGKLRSLNLNEIHANSKEKTESNNMLKMSIKLIMAIIFGLVGIFWMFVFFPIGIACFLVMLGLLFSNKDKKERKT